MTVGLRKYELVGVDDPALYRRLENMIHNYNNARVPERSRVGVDPVEVGNVQLMPSRGGKKWVARALLKQGDSVAPKQVLHSTKEDALLNLLKRIQTEHAGQVSRTHSKITRLKIMKEYVEV